MSGQVIHRLAVGLLALILFVLAAIVGSYDWLPSEIELKRNRLILAATSIQLGASVSDTAKALVEILGPQGLRVYRSDDERRWHISNGLELFEGHWVLTVCFAGNLVSGTHIGTGDDADAPPGGAPAPKGSCLE